MAREKIIEAFRKYRRVLLPPDIDEKDIDRLFTDGFRYRELRDDYAFIKIGTDHGNLTREVEFAFLSNSSAFLLLAFLFEEILKEMEEAENYGYTTTAVYYSHNKNMQKLAPKIAKVTGHYYVWTYRSPDVADFSKAPDRPLELAVPVPDKPTGFEVLSYNGLFLSFYFSGIPNEEWIRGVCRELQVPYFAVFSPYPSQNRKNYLCVEIEFDKEKLKRAIRLCHRK